MTSIFEPIKSLQLFFKEPTIKNATECGLSQASKIIAARQDLEAYNLAHSITSPLLKNRLKILESFVEKPNNNVVPSNNDDLQTLLNFIIVGGGIWLLSKSFYPESVEISPAYQKCAHKAEAKCAPDSADILTFEITFAG